MTRRSIYLQVWLILFTIAVIIVTHSSAPIPLRFAMSIVFLFFCPGVAFVGLLKLQDVLTTLVLSIALSMSLSVIVSEAVLLTTGWSADQSFYILVAITLAGALLQIAAAYYRDSSSPDS